MNIILLSGGSGKRLWPLSNEVRSKQFIKFFKNDRGEYESMLERVYRELKNIDSNVKITIATSKSQISSIINQIGEVGISPEPCRRDTFPAIALACAYMRDIQKANEDEPVIVCPVDPYVNHDYFDAFSDLYQMAKSGSANLCLMGITPTYPSEKYGYIIPKTKEKYSAVLSFKEKPTVEKAKEYIEQGALWNGGIFAFRLGYITKRLEELTSYRSYKELLEHYETLEKISFDYKIVEREKNIQVMRFDGQWMDVGTWNTLAETMHETVIGQGVLDSKCQNVSIVNELDLPILCMGLDDVIVSAGPDGILVSKKEDSSYIKSYVDRFESKTMFAEKSWGSYRVIDVGKNSTTVKVTLKQGSKMNYHSHEHRDECWVIIAGVGKTIVNGAVKTVRCGDVITMPRKTAHTIIAETKLQLIEVQTGENISVSDKTKYRLMGME